MWDKGNVNIFSVFNLIRPAQNSRRTWSFITPKACILARSYVFMDITFRNHISNMFSNSPTQSRKRARSTETQPHKLEYTGVQTSSPPRSRLKIDNDHGNPVVPAQHISKLIQSPFYLTRIQDLPESLNVDSVSLRDILGGHNVKECWDFNYIHDLDFLMTYFDTDVQNSVKAHVVHGFWKRQDSHRLRLEEQAKKYPNLTLHTAYMPEMFGTHHSKMFILFYHDETAQIIIHTANTIKFDWTNMTQGLWKSPVLLKLSETVPENTVSMILGSGSRFKFDFLNYLKAYDRNPYRKFSHLLVEKLEKYDFSSIRAALVASVPGKHAISSESETLWGWAGLQNTLKSVEVRDTMAKAEIIIQVSSIATLGNAKKWLENTLFKALSTAQIDKDSRMTEPIFRLIFPTADEIRRSVNGYDSGIAIHTKIHTAAQVKQLQYLKPLLCHWAGDAAQHVNLDTMHNRYDSGRRRAAPHIKTYIRFSNQEKDSIDWILLTSANLSKQAWGEDVHKSGAMRICSYEIGVMVWPTLFGKRTKLVPTFKKNEPPVCHNHEMYDTVVGIRMPYDLPVIPYHQDAKPWCFTSTYFETDWRGMSHNVHGQDQREISTYINTK